jgi:luciferase family oxidoreductase group 1
MPTTPIWWQPPVADDRHVRLSVLDISPVPSGSTPSDALRNTVDLARLADTAGFERYWLAEHHNTPSIASATPEVLIGHVASATDRIRIGAGGIMLPNHSPLKVAETFRLLEALHPGRIDLGIGRAPGTDGRTALALRRSRHALLVDDFPQQLGELFGFLFDDLGSDHPFHGIVASPSGVAPPDLWILGSSDYGATVAAQLGLGFAFARHIQPEPAVPVLQAYRRSFRPSVLREAPAAILAVSALCAETDDRADALAASLDLAWVRIATGERGAFPSPAEVAAHRWTPQEEALRLANRRRHIIGGPERVRAEIMALADAAGVDEVMVLTMAYDHADRRRSYELLAEAFSVTT